MSETLPITVHVDADPGITNAPYWVIIDPERFKRDIKNHLEGEELESIDRIDNDELMSLMCLSFRGPFFSRAEAESAFKMTVHCNYFTKAAEIYCLSGSSNPQYTKAYKEALAAATDSVAADSGAET